MLDISKISKATMKRRKYAPVCKGSVPTVVFLNRPTTTSTRNN